MPRSTAALVDKSSQSRISAFLQPDRLRAAGEDRRGEALDRGVELLGRRHRIDEAPGERLGRADRLAGQ